MRIAMIMAATLLFVHPAASWAGAAEAFEQLKLLAGEWQADLPGFGKLTSSIRVVSNGRAIEEIIGTPADNELSVYTVNAGKILLTHFCAMTADGHQVRLETPPLGHAADRLDFSFAGSTNLHSPAAPHMRGVLMVISDSDHYSEKWTKTENGRLTVFDLEFVRR